MAGGGRHADTERVDAVDGTDPVASLALGPEVAAVEGTRCRDGRDRPEHRPAGLTRDDALSGGG
ncbi:hypothetical protein [Pseudofrankia sp. BMG5.37]|uniref:hypothetical protein n=1 Tax=Pseudofrankia sp. BMG5.37 TaxID=3050035 RepID=UPI0028A259A3|nr:hypothetical protein [Pseudofrankia sp. BMG5.37]